MARLKRFRATFSGRLVEAVGRAWLPMSDTPGDPGIALDHVRTLRSAMGPAVVRVVATGGTAEQREAIAGEWLCGALDGDNERVPPPQFGYSHTLKWWSFEDSLLRAWESSKDPAWLLWTAGNARVSLRSLTLAAVAAAEWTMRNRMPLVGQQTKRWLADAKRWAKGEAGHHTPLPQEELERVEAEASTFSVTEQEGDEASAQERRDQRVSFIQAAGLAASLADGQQPDRDYDSASANTAHLSGVKVMEAALGHYIDRHRDAAHAMRVTGPMASAIRREISTLEVLRGTVVRERLRSGG